MLKTSKVSEAQNGENGPLTVAREPQSEPSEIATRAAERIRQQLLSSHALGEHSWSSAIIREAIDEAAPAIRAKALREAEARLRQRYTAAVRAVYDGGHVTVTFHDATEELRRMAAEAEKVTP